MDLRATRVEINIAQFQQNLLALKNIVQQRPLCLAVKGNAYGHGLTSIVEYAKDIVDIFAVATVGEGIKLRDSGVTHPIFVMSAHLECEIPLLCQYRLIPFVSHPNFLQQYQYWSEYYKIILPIHIKVDTGMGRAGAMPNEILSLSQQISLYPNLLLEGICTHFAMADDIDDSFTNQQINLFQEIVTTLQQHGITPPLVHATNTAGIMHYPSSYFTLVRAGIGAYGYNTSYKEIQPILSFKSKITIVKIIPKGHGVSYGGSWVAKKDTTVGVIPVGYADGYMRSLSNKANVIIDGMLCPVIGKICMDQIVVELPNFEKNWLETDVLLFGNQQGLTASTVAEWADTIVYEVLTSISERVPRIYI